MAVHSFTDSQVDKVRHALGLDRKKSAYRNCYFCIGDADWDDLVSRGFATKRKSPVSPDFVYSITHEAAFFFMEPTESIDPDLKFPSPTTHRRDGE
jgi:hypothetical protein